MSTADREGALNAKLRALGLGVRLNTDRDRRRLSLDERIEDMRSRLETAVFNHNHGRHSPAARAARWREIEMLTTELAALQREAGR